MAQHDLIARTAERRPHAFLRPVNVAALLRAAQACALREAGTDVTIEVDESVHVPADEATLLSAVGALIARAGELTPGRRIFLSGRAIERGVVIEVETEGTLSDAGARTGSLWRRLASVKAAVEGMGGEAHWSTGAERTGAFVLMFRAPTEPSFLVQRAALRPGAT